MILNKKIFEYFFFFEFKVHYKAAKTTYNITKGFLPGTVCFFFSPAELKTTFNAYRRHKFQVIKSDNMPCIHKSKHEKPVFWTPQIKSDARLTLSPCHRYSYSLRDVLTITCF